MARPAAFPVGQRILWRAGFAAAPRHGRARSVPRSSIAPARAKTAGRRAATSRALHKDDGRECTGSAASSTSAGERFDGSAVHAMGEIIQGLGMDRIALVISDVDGTLVTSQKRVTERTRQAVAALHARGIGFTVVSSRPVFGLRMLIDTLGIAVPVAAFNGGALASPQLAVIE